MPASAEATVLCAAPKSDWTKPSKPHCPRSTVLSNGSFSHAKVPLTFGYAHITVPAWPSLTDASKCGR